MTSADVPGFFVPAAEDSEAAYQAMGQLAVKRRAVVPETPAERPYSMVFESDGETVTATVGQPMTAVTGKGRRRTYRMSVLAIFPPEGPQGSAVVFTDGGSPEWANPFLAGIPRHITMFSS